MEKHTALALATITAFSLLFGPWLSEHFKWKNSDVGKALVASIGLVTWIVVLIMNGVLPSWGTILGGLAVLLWALVIWRLQASLSRTANEVKDEVRKIIGPPNIVVLEGGSVEAPLKYASLSALNAAIAELQETTRQVSKDRNTWETELKKDRDGWKAEADRLRAVNLQGSGK